MRLIQLKRLVKLCGVYILPKPPRKLDRIATTSLHDAIANSGLQRTLRMSSMIRAAHLTKTDGNLLTCIHRIHTQQIYLDSYMRDEIEQKYGVRGWEVWQKVGQAIFIPAGCPHQVCNFEDCIKIASDFVSSENIEYVQSRKAVIINATC